MIRTAAVFITLAFLLNFESNAQNYDPNKIIQPTPTAAALGAYGNNQVGYYTGTPNISIPIYSVKSHDNTLDIHLSYDATGVKVSQDASWTGLGWSLAAGGVITRTVRGYDDFKDIGAYHNAPALPPMPPYTTPVTPAPADKPAYDEIVAGRVDAEPDLFSYNFGPFSGKFVLGKSVDGSIIYFDEQNDLKFEYNGNWIVTDSKGFKYNFATQESASNYAYSSTAAQVSITPDLTPFAFESLNTTAWYLDSIVSPNNDIITFNYVRGQSLSLINMSETQYDRGDNFIGCGTGGQFDLYYKSFNASRQLNNEVYLKSISYINGSVEFNTTDRRDINYSDVNQKPQKLSNITIYDKDHLVLKKYVLDYTYFDDTPPNNTSDYLRLRLDAVTESDKNNVNKPPYRFTYFQNFDLPYKYSKDIDHWGFYNGKGNTRLLPMPNSIRPASYLATDDANRDPDVTQLYIKTGVLSSIQYPTGGHTNFDYELNDYGHLQGDDAYVTQQKGVVAYANPFDQTSHNSTTFDILPSEVSLAGVVSVTFYYTYTYVSGTHLFAGVLVPFGYLSGAGSAQFDNQALMQTDPNGLGGTQSKTLSLPAGHYTLSVNYIQGYSVSVNASYSSRVAVTQKQGGGLRVNSIRNYDNTGIASTKKFLYTLSDGSSSGRLLSIPIYAYHCPGVDVPGTCYPTFEYICRTSGSAYPAGLSAKGAVVGYDKVTEILGENGENGKTEYTYYNQEDVLTGYPGIPDLGYPGIPPKVFPLNGKLSGEIIYNTSGQVLKSIQNSYSQKATSSIYGIKIYTAPPIPIPPNLDVSVKNPYNVYFYQNPSTWNVLDSTKETDNYYLPGGNSAIVTNKLFYYDNPKHLQLTRQVVTKSDGKIITNLSTYADDYPAGTTFIDDMKTAHQTSMPIEEVTYQNTGTSIGIVQGQVTQYKPGGKGQVDQLYKLETQTVKPLSAFKFSNSLIGNLPSNTALSAYSLDSQYQLKTTFNQFDNFGNPLVVTPADQTPAIFVWGYNKQFPIAMIKNSDYATVISLLGGGNCCG